MTDEATIENDKMLERVKEMRLGTLPKIAFSMNYEWHNPETRPQYIQDWLDEED